MSVPDPVTYLSVEDLVEIAGMVIGAPPAVRDYGLLCSTSARPGTVAFGQEVYPDLFDKAATLLHSVCVNLALIDGNRRTAWAAARVLLTLNGVAMLDIDVDAAEVFVSAVASGSLRDVPDIARELRSRYKL